MSEILLPIRPLLHRAISGIEAIYELTSAPWNVDWDGEKLVFGRNAQLPEELLLLWDSPERDSLEALARLVWESAAANNRSTVWFLRNHSPEASLIFLLCAVANVALSTLVTVNLSDNELYQVMSVIVSLTDSPLHISEVPDDNTFGGRLALARLFHGTEVTVCDWSLSTDELGSALRSGLQVFAPGQPSGE